MFMSNSDKERDKEHHSDDDINIDFSKIKHFFSSKTFGVLLLILLILIPVVLTIYVKTLPQSLPATDSMAKSAVNNYYKNNIAQQVNAQYPNLPAQQKQKLIDDQFAQFTVSNKAQIDDQVKQTSTYFKSGFQYTENNRTYTFLGDLDSYYYLREARNIQEKGTPCDEIVDGKCIDNLMLAPIGAELTPYLHPYGIFYLYKILHFINPTVNLMQASFFLPVVLAVIAAVAAFFIGRKLMNDVAGFFAAMFITLSPLIISRTAGSDTDIWNIVLPLVIVWLFLEAFDSDSLIRKLTFTTLTGLVIGIFSFAWGGSWFMFDFIILAIIGHLAFELIRNYIKHKNFKKAFTKDLSHDGIILGTLIVSSAIFVSIFSSFSNFRSFFTSAAATNSVLKVAALSNLWPNVFTTVAELNEASISTIINQTAFGMNMLFALALLGVIFTLVKKKPDFKEYLIIALSAIIFIFLVSNAGMNLNSTVYLLILLIPIAILIIMLLTEHGSTINIGTAALLTIWFIGMIFASIKGLRFILLLIPVFSIAIGVAIGYLYQYFQRVLNEDMKLNKKIASIIVFAVLCLILIAPIQIGISAGESYMPSMTSGWWNTLTKIKQESKPDAIINSWWDFGHWFKYVAERRVTLDGASQNSPNAHWLGLALQANEENRSIGVLRMLDCGSNNAFDEVDKKYMDTEKSENVISEIIVLSKEDAQKRLKYYGFSDTEINTIIGYTHCNPPEDYFITSEDMVGKAGVWAHFGLWSFDKAFIVNNVRGKPYAQGVQLMKDRWNYTDDEASQMYYDVQALTTDSEMNNWISPWPSYATSSMISCQNTPGNIVYCDLNIGIGGNAQQNYVMERAAINMSNPGIAQVLLGVYDRTTNTKIGETTGSWQQVIIVDKNVTRYNMTNVTINMAFLLNVDHTDNTTTYTALVSDPLLIDSTFTKLFYLQGKGTEHFEKFSDVTDMTGTRIIVWKVKW